MKENSNHSRKTLNFSNMLAEVNASQGFQAKDSQSKIKLENQENKPIVKQNLIKATGEKSNPYTGADMFEIFKRSASESKNFEQNQDSKQSAGSSFSFNENNTNRNTFRLNGNKEKSINLLYSHLNEQFPDDTKFTSQLSQGQSTSGITVMKNVNVKRKNTLGN